MKQWHCRYITPHESVYTLLTALTNNGVNPESIKIFTYDGLIWVYYFHENRINVKL